MDRLLAILHIISIASTLVPVVEGMIPGVGMGPHKLNTILNTVNAASQAMPDVFGAIQKKDQDALVTSIASATVSSLNAAGVFKKPTQ